MKTIGLIGGMSWESTVPYYRTINETIRERLGGLHSARLVLYSVDFAEIEEMQRIGDWDRAAATLSAAALSLQTAGADFLVLCTNTMHKVAPAIESVVRIPLIHIVDPTAAELKRQRVRKVGLLGTRFTIEQPFYKDRMIEKFGLEVVVPEEEDRLLVHRVIYEELCLGKLLQASRDRYREVMARLVARGAEAIILGCTEISLLVSETDASVPLFDTTSIHAAGAVDFALQEIDQFPEAAA
jgi:aspartate racemase